MPLFHVVKPLSEHILKIESCGEFGTGFIYFPTEEHMVIVTAKHVIEEADLTGAPITLSNKHWLPPIVIQKSERQIFKNLKPKGDTAILFIETKIFANFPQDIPPFLPWTKRLNIGDEVGWAGFPATNPGTLCFFSGHISAILDEPNNAYLVDGVPITGVSGGPLYLLGNQHTDGLFVIGVISKFYLFETYSIEGKHMMPGLMQAECLHELDGVIAEFYGQNGKV